MLTKELINSLFEYKNGELFRKVVTSRRTKVGEKAGRLNKLNYWTVGIDNKQYLVHRVIFLMHHGYLPKVVDHKDNNTQNNNIENLRDATHSENLLNRGNAKNNTSGIKNVSWNSEKGAWEIRLQVNKKQKHIGYFKDLELAQLVAIMAREKYHGEFANHG